LENQSNIDKWILPLIKVGLIVLIASLAICQLVTQFYFLFTYVKNKVSKDHFEDAKPILSKKQRSERLNLKGRVKRNPSNINYNELFVDPKEKALKKSRTLQYDKHSCYTPQLDRNDVESNLNSHYNKCSNIDEFFDRVREKEDFQKKFTEDIKQLTSNNRGDMNMILQQPPQEKILYENFDTKSVKMSIKDGEDLLVFDSKNDGNDFQGLAADDLVSKSMNKSISILKEKESKVGERTEIIKNEQAQRPEKIIKNSNNEPRIISMNRSQTLFEDHSNTVIMEDPNEEAETSRIEDKIKNSGLFSQTPLTTCVMNRKNYPK
jgi:hypothetical protein